MPGATRGRGTGTEVAACRLESTLTTYGRNGGEIVTDNKQAQTEGLQFASLAAHQMRSPVTAVKTILQTLLGGYVGPLSDKQKELLLRADARCDQALESVRRMLTVARGIDREYATQVADIAAACRRTLLQYASDALQRDISFASDVPQAPVYVAGNEAALCEVVAALTENALKYTPTNGRVWVTLALEAERGMTRLRVSDSGVGIKQADRQRIFEPFFRTTAAKSLSVPGTGLGLAFVKAIVDAVGGNVGAGRSDLGGAEITVELPLAQATVAAEQGKKKMSGPMKVVIVGGVAAGPKVASKIIRLMPDAEVTVVEKGKLLSYAGCGLPYYVSGVVCEQKQLMSSAVGVLRDTVFFQHVKNVRVMNQTDRHLLQHVLARLRSGADPERGRFSAGSRHGWRNRHVAVRASGIERSSPRGSARPVALRPCVPPW